jgi:hypothetical protein
VVDRDPPPDVRYYEYRPTTIDYRPELNAYVIGRADVHSYRHRHRLAIVIVVTDLTLQRERMSVDEAIQRGQTLLEQLVVQHRRAVDHLTASASWFFNLGGERVE